jgi:hypothetical protein
MTYVTILDHKAVIDTWFEHFQHLHVLHVVTNMFKNIAVRHDTQGSEDDPDGNVDFYIWDGRFHDVSSLSQLEHARAK